MKGNTFMDNSFNPKVSIVIPVYNGSDYLKNAIDSALAQTYENIEVIVVNDGSTDGGKTEKIAKSYGDKICYFAKSNGGVATALNFGIDKMSGEYFSWLSHDDMYSPQKIEHELCLALSQEDKTTIVAEGYQVVDHKGKYLYSVNLHERFDFDADKLKNALFVLLNGGINGCALLIHKSHFERVGNFNHDLPTTQDFDLFFRMFRGQSIIYSKANNVLSRSHPAQDSKAMLAEHIEECDELWIRMTSSLSDEEKTDIAGSPFLFFEDLKSFLTNHSSYKTAIDFVSNMAYIEAVKEYKTSEDTKLLSWICADSGFSKDALSKFVPRYMRKNDERPRIAYFLEECDTPGGLNRVAFQISGMLSEYCDVLLIYSLLDNSPAYSIPDNVRKIRIPWRNWDPHVSNKLNRLCYLLDINILVVSYNCAVEYLDIYKKAKIFGTKTIAWNHEHYLLPYWRTSLHKALAYRNEKLSNADVVIWLNSFSAAAYGLHQNNGARVPNPCTADIPDTVPDRQRANKLIAVGRFDDSQKGLEALLRMFSIVVKSRPDVTLTVIGSYNLNSVIPSGSNTTYLKLIRRLGIPKENLIFTGWVDDIESYYKNSDINILSSIYEGFGLVVLEAAAFGIPTVALSGTGVDDIITHGADGLLSPIGNHQLMAENVLSLVSNEDYFQKMSREALKLPSKYAPEKVAQIWLDIINAVFTKEPEDLHLHLKKSYRPEVPDKEQFYRELAGRYENCISWLAERCYNINVYNISYEEYLSIVKSKSWRITYPLRLFSTAFFILKTEGVKSLITRIKKKLASRPSDWS